MYLCRYIEPPTSVRAPTVTLNLSWDNIASFTPNVPMAGIPLSMLGGMIRLSVQVRKSIHCSGPSNLRQCEESTQRVGSCKLVSGTIPPPSSAERTHKRHGLKYPYLGDVFSHVLAAIYVHSRGLVSRRKIRNFISRSFHHICAHSLSLPSPFQISGFAMVSTNGEA